MVCDESLPPILVDRRRMAQVLTDLAENATRYAPEGTVVQVEARHQRAGVVRTEITLA